MATEDPDHAQIEEWQALGLYDPAAADAADRLELLEYATASGLELDEIIARSAAGTLTRGPVDRLIRVDRVYTTAEVAARSGLTVGEVDRVWLAIGLPLVPAGEAGFNDGDVELLTAFADGRRLLTVDGMLQLCRVMAASMARIAEAAVASFLVRVEQPLTASGVGEATHARARVQSAELLFGLPDMFRLLFQRQVELAVERTRAAREPDTYDRFRLAVCFLDLVGYTAWSVSQRGDDLAAAVGDFERLANDRIATGHARVVKFIGDAVMFVAPDAAAAATIALDLCAAVHEHPVLTELRAAIATGDLLGRDGDYYGPTVNLAARALKAAPPGGLVSDAPIEGFATVALGDFELHGIDEPVSLYRVAEA